MEGDMSTFQLRTNVLVETIPHLGRYGGQTEPVRGKRERRFKIAVDCTSLAERVPAFVLPVPGDPFSMIRGDEIVADGNCLLPEMVARKQYFVLRRKHDDS